MCAAACSLHRNFSVLPYLTVLPDWHLFSCGMLLLMLSRATERWASWPWDIWLRLLL